MLQSGDHELAFICSEYESATPQVNKQIAKINKITKSYDKTSMVIGEAPLMKDLEDVTNIDIQNVNVASIAAIFIIILIIFKSISLPVILVSIIEFAIAVNMAVPYYQGVSLPFVASIVIGTIQLGATVDYAIVYTSRYLKERRNGKNKLEAVSIAHKSNMLYYNECIESVCCDLWCSLLLTGRYDRFYLYVISKRCCYKYDRCFNFAANDVPYF